MRVITACLQHLAALLPTDTAVLECKTRQTQSSGHTMSNQHASPKVEVCLNLLLTVTWNCPVNSLKIGWAILIEFSLNSLPWGMTGSVPSHSQPCADTEEVCQSLAHPLLIHLANLQSCELCEAHRSSLISKF